MQPVHTTCLFRGGHTTPQSQSTFATSNLKAQCCFKIRRRTTEPRLPSVSLILFLLLLISCCSLSQTTRGVQANDESPTSRPRITIQPNDLVAIEGESAELNCDAEGEPEPTIEWYHNGQLIRSSTNSRTTMGGSIQFLDIRPPIDSGAGSGSGLNYNQQQPSDAGVYHCLAKNQFGQERSRNATLQVACKYTNNEILPRPESHSCRSSSLPSLFDWTTFGLIESNRTKPNRMTRGNLPSNGASFVRVFQSHHRVETQRARGALKI